MGIWDSDNEICVQLQSRHRRQCLGKGIEWKRKTDDDEEEKEKEKEKEEEEEKEKKEKEKEEEEKRTNEKQTGTKIGTPSTN
ncbi:hypothetical protein M8J77_012353 [Diaphorina citri]|nr:hypothetical protein M8J77_012353 [Diaphorina citri]